jgi:hypothetical protein
VNANRILEFGVPRPVAEALCANSFWLWRSLPRVGKVFSLAIHDGTSALRFWRTSENGIWYVPENPTACCPEVQRALRYQFWISIFLQENVYVILSFGKNTKNLVPRGWFGSTRILPP